MINYAHRGASEYAPEKVYIKSFIHLAFAPVYVTRRIPMKLVLKNSFPLYPVPKLMTRKELKTFYYKIADWSE